MLDNQRWQRHDVPDRQPYDDATDVQHFDGGAQFGETPLDLIAVVALELGIRRERLRQPRVRRGEEDLGMAPVSAWPYWRRQ